MRAWAVLAATAMTSLALFVPAGLSSAPVPVTIFAAGFVPPWTFTATGPRCTSGSSMWLQTDGSISLPLRVSQLFVCSDGSGSFTMDWVGTHGSVGDLGPGITGHFHIAQGTGEWSSLRGHGTFRMFTGPSARDAPGKNRTCARGLGNRCSIH
jgi:hypothetical protein